MISPSRLVNHRIYRQDVDLPRMSVREGGCVRPDQYAPNHTIYFCSDFVHMLDQCNERLSKLAWNDLPTRLDFP